MKNALIGLCIDSGLERIPPRVHSSLSIKAPLDRCVPLRLILKPEVADFFQIIEIRLDAPGEIGDPLIKYPFKESSTPRQAHSYPLGKTSVIYDNFRALVCLPAMSVVVDVRNVCFVTSHRFAGVLEFHPLESFGI